MNRHYTRLPSGCRSPPGWPRGSENPPELEGLFERGTEVITRATFPRGRATPTSCYPAFPPPPPKRAPPSRTARKETHVELTAPPATTIPRSIGLALVFVCGGGGQPSCNTGGPELSQPFEAPRGPRRLGSGNAGHNGLRLGCPARPHPGPPPGGHGAAARGRAARPARRADGRDIRRADLRPPQDHLRQRDGRPRPRLAAGPQGTGKAAGDALPAPDDRDRQGRAGRPGRSAQPPLRQGAGRTGLRDARRPIIRASASTSSTRTRWATPAPR